MTNEEFVDMDAEVCETFEVNETPVDIDFEVIKEATVKVSRKARKPIEGTTGVVVYLNGEEVAVVAPMALENYVQTLGLDAKACQSIVNRYWCNVEGYTFVERGV